MGYIEVYEKEQTGRQIYGVSKSDSDTVKIHLLEWLFSLSPSYEAQQRLIHLYNKYNRGAVRTPSPVINTNLIYWGVGEPTPTTSEEVLAMNKATVVNGKFILNTGNSETKFKIVLAPGINISSVLDETAILFNIQSQFDYIGTVPVDIGLGPVAYNLYEMNTSIPYEVSHKFIVSI